MRNIFKHYFKPFLLLSTIVVSTQTYSIPKETECESELAQKAKLIFKKNIEFGKIKTHIRVISPIEGTNNYVLAIHGMFGTTTVWSELELPFVNNGIGVIEYDLVNHGHNVLHAEPKVDSISTTAFQDNVELLKLILQYLKSEHNIDKPILFGHSMGATIAFEALRQNNTIQEMISPNLVLVAPFIYSAEIVNIELAIEKTISKYFKKTYEFKHGTRKNQVLRRKQILEYTEKKFPFIINKIIKINPKVAKKTKHIESSFNKVIWDLLLKHSQYYDNFAEDPKQKDIILQKLFSSAVESIKDLRNVDLLEQLNNSDLSNFAGIKTTVFSGERDIIARLRQQKDLVSILQDKSLQTKHIIIKGARHNMITKNIDELLKEIIEIFENYNTK